MRRTKDRAGEREKGGKGEKDKIFFSHSPILPLSHSIFSSPPRSFIALFLVALAIACAYAFLAPKEYESTATLLKPFPKEESEFLKLIATDEEPKDQQDRVRRLAPALRWGGWKLTNILQSRYMAEQVVNKLNLAFTNPKSKIQNPKSTSKAVEMLRKKVTIVSDPSIMTLRITARAKTPELAAKIANCYVELLDEYVTKNNLTTADRLRQFMLDEIERVKSTLHKAEEALREFEETNNISYPDELKTLTAEAWRIRNEGLNLQAKSEALRRLGAAEENVEAKAIKAQLNAAYAQIKSILKGKENEPSATSVTSATYIPISLAPQLEMKLSKLIREVNVQRGMYVSLLKEYEYSNVFFQEEGANFHLMDKAIPIYKAAKPNKWLIISIGAIMGMLLGSVIPVSRMILSQFISDQQLAISN